MTADKSALHNISKSFVARFMTLICDFQKMETLILGSNNTIRLPVLLFPRISHRLAVPDAQLPQIARLE